MVGGKTKGDLPGVPMEPQTYDAFTSSPSGIRQINALDYFSKNPTMEEELADLPVPRSYEKTIFLFHAPPFQTRLDHLYEGRPFGSRAIRRYIERYQPLLTLHGHIHESPYQSGNYLGSHFENI
ncbi:MAG: metallophosphoesterase [Deltaproteobacteria bacterium]|nr:metallophosphoesterase [Deltaproteobacteria bacterium]